MMWSSGGAAFQQRNRGRGARTDVCGLRVGKTCLDRAAGSTSFKAPPPSQTHLASAQPPPYPHSPFKVPVASEKSELSLWTLFPLQRSLLNKVYP